MLLEDGKLLTQSLSIGRYLARKYNLVTHYLFLSYRSEQVVDILEDTRKVNRKPMNPQAKTIRSAFLLILQ